MTNKIEPLRNNWSAEAALHYALEAAPQKAIVIFLHPDGTWRNVAANMTNSEAYFQANAFAWDIMQRGGVK